MMMLYHNLGGVFNSLIHGFCTIVKWFKADESTFEMLDRGIHPSVVYFNTIIGNLCQEGSH